MPDLDPLQQMAREVSLSPQIEPVQAKDEIKRENDAAHAILRGMFPRQYGLPSVFNSQSNDIKNKVGHYLG